MKKYCVECGKEIQATHNVCIHCGTPVKPAETTKEAITASQPEKPPRKPLTKKQKWIGTIIASIVVVIIGFSMWANHYQSAEVVEKRFEKAVEEESNKTLKRLMIHEDGSPISQFEAKAFIELIKQRGDIMKYELTTVVQRGKFLGIYDAHKIEVIDQYAIGYHTDGISYAFNDMDVDEYERTDNTITVGPLAPGVYHVEVTIENDFGEYESEGHVTLDQVHDYNEINIDMPIDEVTFYVDNYHQLKDFKINIQIGDHTISINDNGETDAVGPMKTDGSLEATIHVELPWGNVESDPIEITERSMEVHAQFVTSDQFEQTLDLIEDFGEQYVESLAKNHTKPLKSVPKIVKEFVENKFNQYYEAYTGKVDTISVNENAIYIETDDKPKIFIPVQYGLKGNNHDLDADPELQEYQATFELGLSYHSDDENWQIHSVNNHGYFGDFGATKTWDGSGKTYGPDKKAIAKANEASFEDDLFQFVEEYTSANIKAINERNFDLMIDYTSKDGPRRKEARDYIDYLESEDVYETWFGSELESVEELDDQTWKITVIEEFEIIWPHKTDIKEFRTKLIIKEIDGTFYVDELTETKET